MTEDVEKEKARLRKTIAQLRHTRKWTRWTAMDTEHIKHLDWMIEQLKTKLEKLGG